MKNGSSGLHQARVGAPRLPPHKVFLMFLLLYLRQGHPWVPSVSKLKVILREEIGEGPMVVSFFEIKKKPFNVKKDI